MAGQKFQITPFVGAPPGFQQYLQQQVDRLWEMIQGGDALLQLNMIYVEPAKPREGMLVLADGTEWDPGDGQGVYAYYNGTWNALHL